MIAKYMKDLSNVAGDAKLYALDEPLDGADYLAVAVINDQFARWRQVITQILPSFESGASWRGLDGSLSMVIEMQPHETPAVPPATRPTLTPVSHDEALLSLGYTADYTPWPEPEPTFKMIRALQALALTDPAGNVLNLAEGDEVELPIPVADNLIGQGVVVAVEED